MTADYGAALALHRFDLLLKGEALVALVETLDEGDGLLIVNLAVSPAFQRQGLGSGLIAQAEQAARRLGHRRARLYTNQKLVENIRLYARLGYRIDREEDVGVAIVVHMSKDLTA